MTDQVIMCETYKARNANVANTTRDALSKVLFGLEATCSD
jgi:hypothetical protein